MQVKDVIAELCHHQGGIFLSHANIYAMIKWERKKSNVISDPDLKVQVFTTMLRMIKSVGGLTAPQVQQHLPVVVILTQMKNKVR